METEVSPLPRQFRQNYRYFTMCNWCDQTRKVRALHYMNADGRSFYRYVCSACDR